MYTVFHIPDAFEYLSMHRVERLAGSCHFQLASTNAAQIPLNYHGHSMFRI